jgi:hypothetical protein
MEHERAMNYLERLIRRAKLDYSARLNPTARDPFEEIEEEARWPEAGRDAEVGNTTSVISNTLVADAGDKGKASTIIRSTEVASQAFYHEASESRTVHEHTPISPTREPIRKQTDKPGSNLDKNYLNEDKRSIVEEIVRSVIEPGKPEIEGAKATGNLKSSTGERPGKAERTVGEKPGQPGQPGRVHQVLPPEEKVQYSKPVGNSKAGPSGHEADAAEHGPRREERALNQAQHKLTRTPPAKVIVVNKKSSIDESEDNGGGAPHIGIGQL